MSETRSAAVSVILVILGILFVLPGACGSYFVVMIAEETLNGAKPVGSDGAGYGLLIGSVASGSVLLTFILLGVLMRASSRAWSPTGSLVIAVAAAAFAIANHFVFLAIAAPISDAKVYVFAFTALAFGLGVLPPIFHWRSNRQA